MCFMTKEQIEVGQLVVSAVGFTHLALEKDAPLPRPIARPTARRVVAIPEVGGLHHRYERRAA
jgi:hypothetical protein